MITENIKNKIESLTKNRNHSIGVAFGKKIKNGEFTGHMGFIFFVEKKLPLNELNPDQIVPKEINVGQELYITDVVEIGKLKALANIPIGSYGCENPINNSCYNWAIDFPNNVPNFSYQRPLRGGLGITSFNNDGSYGTLGFIAVDKETQSLVGVTNNHVVIKNAFYTAGHYSVGFQDVSVGLENEIGNKVYQSATNINNPSTEIGRVLRYKPLKNNLCDTNQNFIDCAIFSIKQSEVDNESYKIYGLTGFTSPMDFATTEEIDDLLTTNPPLISVGATTGIKEGHPCGLEVYAIGLNSIVGGYHNQTITDTALFKDCIIYTRKDFDFNQCPYPIFPGDSGSAIVGNFNGTYKIIGLAFAGNSDPFPFIGIACRIDRIANELNIEPWLGGTKNFINPNSIQMVTITGGSISDYVICDGKKYWQWGLTNYKNEC